MGPQDGLDLDTRHVDCATTHDVLLAIDEEEVAVGVEVAQISGEEPTVAYRSRVGLVVVDVAAEVDVVELEGDFSHLVGRRL